MTTAGTERAPIRNWSSSRPRLAPTTSRPAPIWTAAKAAIPSAFPATNADDLAGAPAEDSPRRPGSPLAAPRPAPSRTGAIATGCHPGNGRRPVRHRCHERQGRCRRVAGTYLILHDSAGRTLAESGDDVSDANAEAGLSFVTTEGGLYYVEVASFLDLFTGTLPLSELSRAP